MITYDRRKDKKKGILFVVPWEISFQGGVNEVVRNLAFEAQKNNYYPVILEVLWGYWLPKIEQYEYGIRIKYSITVHATKKGRIKNLISKFHKQFQRFIFKLVLKKYNICLINLHYINPYIKFFIENKNLNRRIPLIASFHGTDVDSFMKVPSDLKNQHCSLLNRVDIVTVCSEDLRRRVLDLSEGNLGNIKVINNGISPEIIDSEIDNSDFHDVNLSGEYIIAIGTFVKSKGHDILIEAFSEARKANPKLKLVIVGRNTPYANELAKLVKKHNMSGKVLMFKDLAHKDTMKLLSNAQICVLPSLEEAFGLVLIEAGILGVPIVASRTGGIPDVLDNGGCGLLVEPGDKTQLKLAIMNILSDEQLATELSVKMKMRVCEKYLWINQAKKYFDLLEQANKNYM